MNRIRTKFLKWISRLHIEEVIALVFFIPSFIITVKANLYFSDASLVIPRRFYGGWLTRTEKKLIRMDPTSARGAFPSLHNAVTLITLMYAYVNSKKLFWILLIPAISLVISTIYLRHHYAIDLFAGWILAVVTYYMAPYVDRWWEGKRLNLAEKIR